MALDPDDLDPVGLTDRGRPTILQTISGLIGLLITIAGVVMLVFLFVSVADVVLHPETIGGTVDAWENVLRGEAELGDTTITINLPSGDEEASASPVAAPSPRVFDSATTASIQAEYAAYPAPHRAVVTKQIIPVRIKVARAFAVVVMLILLSVLVRMAAELIKCGGKLVSLANPIHDFYDRLVKQLARSGRRPSPRDHRDYGTK